MADSTLVYDLAADILACVTVALENTSNGAPDHRYVSMGEPAHDNCCEAPGGGQLTVNVARIYPSRSFPEPDEVGLVCGAPYTVCDIDVEVIRCAPSSDANGNPPSAAALGAAARIGHIDGRAVWDGILCCLLPVRDTIDTLMRDQVPIDASGGCVGSRTRVTIGLQDGCHCP